LSRGGARRAAIAVYAAALALVLGRIALWLCGLG